MTDNSESDADGSQINLQLQRLIKAPVERVFAAWTQVEHLLQWWGPQGVSCPQAEIDLRAGGRYRIWNQLEDGKLIEIFGQFEELNPPHKLVYSWNLSTGPVPRISERVSVEFVSVAEGTQLTLVHARIRDQATRDQHESGWNGCLQGLESYLEHLC